ncbi:MAG: hypothetical protein IT381_04605 [Deltaproteobacteria bacterium]|nr:hypothetical protein [Deltaproteobacteria bacterium]
MALTPGKQTFTQRMFKKFASKFQKPPPQAAAGPTIVLEGKRISFADVKKRLDDASPDALAAFIAALNKEQVLDKVATLHAHALWSRVISALAFTGDLAPIGAEIDALLASGKRLTDDDTKRLKAAGAITVQAAGKNDAALDALAALLVVQLPADVLRQAAKAYFRDAVGFDATRRAQAKPIYAALSAANALYGGDPELKKVLSEAGPRVTKK